MVDTWGYPAFDSFYRDIRPFKNGSHAEAIDQALQKHFGLTLAELDERYQEALARRPLNPDLEQDVYLTVTYFDAVRRYQLDLDPSAHFLTAWLVYLNEMQQFGDEEDYLRHPDDPANLALETMLINAENQLVLGQFQEAQTTLGAVNFVLTQIEKGNPAPFDSHPLAANYYHIVTLLLDQGYQPQQITLEGGRAQALVYTSDQQVILVTLVYSQDTWSFE
jgi:hypothetical protein